MARMVREYFKQMKRGGEGLKNTWTCFGARYGMERVPIIT